MNRNFEEWLSKFRVSIAGYDYYVNFKKVIQNVENLKIELNILNSLVGSRDIETEFETIMHRYPQALKCIPLLLAVHEKEIYIRDEEADYRFDFQWMNYDIEQYKVFMRKTGLFDLLSNHLINNLVDYVSGVETGLDSNGRKNRGGHLMEDLVESFIQKSDVEYYKEMYLADIEKRWGIDVSALSNNGKARKRFDFVVKGESKVYAIETNFYSGSKGGSKLNETARSYKMLAQEAKMTEGFEFVWFTDGTAWNKSKGNLRETFDTMEHIYSIDDMEKGIMNQIFQ